MYHVTYMVTGECLYEPRYRKTFLYYLKYNILLECYVCGYKYVQNIPPLLNFGLQITSKLLTKKKKKNEEKPT